MKKWLLIVGVGAVVTVLLLKKLIFLAVLAVVGYGGFKYLTRKKA
jgi:hypothetical protein